jgi:ketosteroid isomerase-like protein
VKSIKVLVALIFLAGIVASLASHAFAYPPFLAKAKKFGAKDCTFCHVDPDGGPPWNERGKWLVEEKERRKADVVDVEWLADYKPGAQPAKAPDTKMAEKPAPAPSTTSSVEQELLKLEREWLDAYIKRDVAAMERIEADDFVITFPNGSMSNKAQQVAALKGPAPTGPPPQFYTEETKVRLLGDDVAILTGIFVSKYQTGGKEVMEKSRYTDVWAKRGGRWQVVASHLSRLASPQGSAPQSNEGAAVKVDPNVFDAYVGEYELPMFTIIVTREGDKLFGQPPGDTKEELVPLSDTEFNVTNVNAKVKFVKDATGKVTHMMVTLNGQDVQGKKTK